MSSLTKLTISGTCLGPECCEQTRRRRRGDLFVIRWDTPNATERGRSWEKGELSDQYRARSEVI